MFNKKSFGIVYLERGSFSYYRVNTPPVSFTYPASSIKELEVFNEQVLISEATNFLQSNKIIPLTVMFLLSPDVLYEKEFIYETVDKKKDVDNNKIEPPIPNEPQNPVENIQPQKGNLELMPVAKDAPLVFSAEERNRQIQSFLDIVPFEEIASKSYKIDKGIKVIATNKKLYEILIHVFMKMNFVIDSVIPITAIPKNIISIQSLNQDNAKKILKKLEALRVYSMLEENSYALSRAALSPHGITMSTKVSSKREFALIGIFLVLITTLGIVVYAAFISPSKDTKVASMVQQISPTIMIPPSITPEPIVVATESASVNKEELRILLSGGTNTQLNLLRQDLISSGYGNIIMRPNNVPATGRALVIFSSNLPATTKEQILGQLRQSLLNVSAQESASPEADVIVNL